MTALLTAHRLPPVPCARLPKPFVASQQRCLRLVPMSRRRTVRIRIELEGDDEDEYAHEMAIRRLRTQALVLNIAQEGQHRRFFEPSLVKNKRKIKEKHMRRKLLKRLGLDPRSRAMEADDDDGTVPIYDDLFPGRLDDGKEWREDYDSFMDYFAESEADNEVKKRVMTRQITEPSPRWSARLGKSNAEEEDDEEEDDEEDEFYEYSEEDDDDEDDEDEDDDEDDEDEDDDEDDDDEDEDEEYYEYNEDEDDDEDDDDEDEDDEEYIVEDDGDEEYGEGEEEEDGEEYDEDDEEDDDDYYDVNEMFLRTRDRVNANPRISRKMLRALHDDEEYEDEEEGDEQPGEGEPGDEEAAEKRREDAGQISSHGEEEHAETELRGFNLEETEDLLGSLNISGGKRRPPGSRRGRRPNRR